MPGNRDSHLRSGDLHEELGIFLLKTIALVAPVPRPEDVGHDGFATLIRPEGSRRLIPDLSFLVQLKAISIKSVKYRTQDEMNWIRALEVPLLIGRVNLRQASIELFTTQRLYQVLLEHGIEKIELLLNQASERVTRSGIRRANLGAPIHAWSIADIKEPDFLKTAHAVLRPHIEALQRNRQLRAIQSQTMLTWETGQPPTPNGEMTLISPQHGIADTLQDMAPHARRLMTEIGHQKKYRDFPIILAFFDLMRRWGLDPDPNGSHRMGIALLAEGPEISVEEAIQLRYAFSPRKELNLSSLPVTDSDLASIPGDVRYLALKDTLITDQGLEHLSRLTEILNVNLAGTQITDDGLQELVKLPNLEWLCVNRTHVTAAGVERLKANRPSVDVRLDSEP